MKIRDLSGMKTIATAEILTPEGPVVVSLLQGPDLQDGFPGWCYVEIIGGPFTVPAYGQNRREALARWSRTVEAIRTLVEDGMSFKRIEDGG